MSPHGFLHKLRSPGILTAFSFQLPVLKRQPLSETPQTSWLPALPGDSPQSLCPCPPTWPAGSRHQAVRHCAPQGSRPLCVLRPDFFRDSHPLAGGAQPLGACPLPGKTFFFQACLVEGLIRTRGGERPSPRSEGLPRPLVSRLLPRTWVALMSVLPVSPEGPGVCSVWSWAPSHREAPPGGCSPHALPGSPTFGLGDPTPRFLGLLFL